MELACFNFNNDRYLPWCTWKYNGDGFATVSNISSRTDFAVGSVNSSPDAEGVWSWECKAMYTLLARNEKKDNWNLKISTFLFPLSSFLDETTPQKEQVVKAISETIQWIFESMIFLPLNDIISDYMSVRKI